MKTLASRALCAFALLLSLGGAWAQSAAAKLPTVRLNAGIHNIDAEVARTAEQRTTGLMFRRELGANDGMLFIFERPQTQCFWMRNTLIPLAIAFVADDGRIVGLDEMQPLTETSHCSAEPVRYVLEMNAGWFEKRGIKPGMKLSGKPFKP
jgi:uncharacterized membrane protein (UPF0127 family)